MEKNIRFPSPPKVCDECASQNIALISNEAIHGEPKGVWPYIYICKDCLAYVSCHPNTVFPMGRLANNQIRYLRHKLHSAFDFVWKNKICSRNEAYEWLAKKLEIPFDDCHIAMLSKQNLLKGIEVCVTLHEEMLQRAKEIETEIKIENRRNEKKNESESKRLRKERKSFNFKADQSRKHNRAARRLRKSGDAEIY